MATNTKIEWCDYTINPVVGCSKCSIGCQSCFAEKFASRLAKNPNPKISAKYAGVVDNKGHWTGKMGQPSLADFRKLPKSPRRVFVGSMTDIFHDEIVKGGEYHKTWLPMLFDAMLTYSQHTFLLLTKRPENMKKWIDFGLEHCVDKPLSNVWLGVTVCNQEEADKKIPILLQTAAVKRFVSVEPMLGRVDINQYLQGENKLDWIIAGGETGLNARPVHEAWVKNLRDRCLETGTPYFFKSWGDWCPYNQLPTGYNLATLDPFDRRIVDNAPDKNNVVIRVNKRISGHLIDGVEYRQFPEK